MLRRLRLGDWRSSQYVRLEEAANSGGHRVEFCGGIQRLLAQATIKCQA